MYNAYSEYNETKWVTTCLIRIESDEKKIKNLKKTYFLKEYLWFMVC